MPHLLATLASVVLVTAVASPLPDDPPKKLSNEERQKLDAEWLATSNEAIKLHHTGKPVEAEKMMARALELARQLWPKNEFPDGHPDLATTLGNRAYLLQALGKNSQAEPFSRECLAIQRKLIDGDHPDLASSMTNLGMLLHALGKEAEAEPLYRDALAMRKRLFKGDHLQVAASLGHLGNLLLDRGKFTEAEAYFAQAVDMSKRAVKGDNLDVALNINNLAVAIKRQGRYVEAENLYRQSLEMKQRLFKGNHPSIPTALHNLALVLKDQGKLTEAETLARTAVEANQRIFQGDHPDIVLTLSSLATILQDQDRLAEADSYYREALAMSRRLFAPDHPYTGSCMNNLGNFLKQRSKVEEAERLFRESLEAARRRRTGDHPEVATCLHNLAGALREQGRYEAAEPLAQDALAMTRRLHPGDHPHVADTLTETADLLRARGKFGEALTLYREALAMYRNLVGAYASAKTEGEALTLVGTIPAARDAFLSTARAMKADPSTVYSEVWASKSAVMRVYERRLQATRAAATDPKASKLLAELADARRRRAELILAPEPIDPATRTQRDNEIKSLDRTLADLNSAVRPLLPALDRTERLSRATPADLQKLLPNDAVVVDFLRYVLVEQDPARPGKVGEKQTTSYLAFVITRDQVKWVDLGPAHPIEEAVIRYQVAITSGKEIPPAIPARLRELVWEKVRKNLPSNVGVVYVSPDWALTEVAWAALPGDKPGTILLEDFAVAIIPHGTFLLDQFWPREARTDLQGRALVVGGVDYDAAPEAGLVAGRELPIKKGTQLRWPALPAAAAEATGVAAQATRRKLTVTSLRAKHATPAAVLTELPKVRYAHLATHGFFADPSFQSVFQLDPSHFIMHRRGQRVGAGALSPLVMTGLVLAGANDPKAPGRGVVTGESLVDLDLSGLELAVLSACETGLGDVAGGEGTFGLQRAFHLAGTRNVVATLWKVPDQPTAALMGVFYRNLWEKNLTPIEALRQAQLEVYRNPGKIGTLAEGFRGQFEEVPGAIGRVESADGKTHPRHWAAFTLSGPGR